MISEHEVAWVVKNPPDLEEISFKYPDEVVEGQRVRVISTLRNNTNESKRAKLTVYNADTGQELLSSEGDIGPFATVDISVAGVPNHNVRYKAKVEEET